MHALMYAYMPVCFCVCREALREVEALLKDDADHLRKAQQVGGWVPY